MVQQHIAIIERKSVASGTTCSSDVKNLTIGSAIKRLDKRDIVRMTGIDRHTLNNICKCKTKGIEFETLNKLCFALDCTLNDLFRYVPDENPPV